MNPALKRFHHFYGVIADAIARLDLDQEDREAVALAIASALQGRKDFRPDLFTLLASDPLVPCAGTGEGPCPNGVEIRLMWHNRDDPQGRSEMWEQRAPYGRIRCVSCGAKKFLRTGR